MGLFDEIKKDLHIGEQAPAEAPAAAPESPEVISSVTYDNAGNVVPESPEVVSSVTYDAAGNAMTPEQVAAAAQAEAEAKAAADAAAAQAAADAAAAAAAQQAAADAAAAAAAAAAAERTYTVVKGDTLSAIGHKFGVDWHKIAEHNGIANPNLIYPGQVFKIPS